MAYDSVDKLQNALGEKVFQAANEPKSFVKMRGDHNSGILVSQPDYERALGAFVSLASKGKISLSSHSMTSQTPNNRDQ